MREFDRIFGEGFRAIVVNDGSRDRTGEILDDIVDSEPRLRVIHQRNSGHGGALRRGYEEALELEPEFVFQVDSDGQFEPEDFGRLWCERERSPCILGDRFARCDAFHRLVITRLLRGLLVVLYGVRVKDSNIPFRLLAAGFLRKALALIPADAAAPNIFIAVIASRMRVDLGHIPVRHYERSTGKVSIVRWRLLRLCGRCALELLRFRPVLRTLPSNSQRIPAFR
jgi:glycosyltransferase involved in cell wall biosynthesis